jgi:hypothetical protein
MPYVLIQGGIVVQKQPNEQDFFIAAPDWVVCGYAYADGVFTVPAATTPTGEAVSAERDRRLALGMSYDFGDARGVHIIGTTDADMRRWMDEVTPMAQACINVGQPDQQIGILTNTAPTVVTAMEWQHILLAAATYRQPLYQASFALPAMEPIPADFADDEWWPTTT